MVEGIAMKICLITGANRGIGHEISIGLGLKGYHIFATCRTDTDVITLNDTFNSLNISATIFKLDVVDIDSIKELYTKLEKEIEHLDVLINNAGILLDSTLMPHEVEPYIFQKTLSTNVVGPFFLISTFLPLLEKSYDARVINVSSDLGSLSEISQKVSKYDYISAPSYRISKAALNMMTLVLSKNVKEGNIKFCSYSPGWCQTELDLLRDSNNAPNTAAQGADTAIWLASEAPEDIIDGNFFYNRKLISW